MQPLLRVIILIYFIPNVYPVPHHHTTGTAVSRIALKDIPPEYLRALRAFNRQNVQAPSFSNFDRSPDAVFSDPITLATLWAIVNEPVFDIETVDIHRALGLIPEEIPKVYASVNNFLTQVSKVHNACNLNLNNMQRLNINGGKMGMNDHLRT